MNYASGWDFTLANYDAVWGFLVQFGLLLLFLMLGNISRRTIPLFRKCLIPSALLGGALLLNNCKQDLCGTVKLIFQPAEEICKGASAVISQGFVDDVVLHSVIAGSEEVLAELLAEKLNRL